MRLIKRVTGDMVKAFKPSELSLRGDELTPGLSESIRSGCSNQDLTFLKDNQENNSTGSRLLDIETLNEAYSLTIAEHAEYLKKNRRINHAIKFAWAEERRHILAVSVQLKCTHPRCTFTSSTFQLYQTVPNMGKGRPSAQANVALATYLLITKATPDDIVDAFTMMSVPMPQRGGNAFQPLLNSS